MKCLVSMKNLTSLYLYNSPPQVVLCSLAALVLSEAEPDAQSALMNNINLPYGFGYGAVSSTNVNVPGQFSYVVNSVHPTDSEVAPTEALSPAVNYLPAGYGYNPYNTFHGLRNNFYNPWASGYSMGMGRMNPFYGGYPFGYNSLGLGLHYPYGGLGYVPAPAPAPAPMNEE